MLDGVRALATMYGPSLLLDLFVAGSLLAAARGALTRPPKTRMASLLRLPVCLGVAAPLTYLLAIRPGLRGWGATAEEARQPLPGDELVPDPAIDLTWAVTIDAPVEAVWPWLAQVGQDRGGFYSYTWLENLAGCRMRNADRLQPEWQQREVGEIMPLHPSFGLEVTCFELNQALVLKGWGSFVLEPIDASHTRLISRSRVPSGWPAVSYALLLEIPHFVMQRKMLLGIKQRAERMAHGGTLLDQVLPTADYSGQVSVTILASPAAIFRALRDVTLSEMPLANALGTIRYLPGRLSGRATSASDVTTRPFFDLMAPCILAEEPDREVVIGNIGKLHDLLDQQFVPLDGPQAFSSFNRPDYEKLAQSIRIAGGDEVIGYTVVGEHRTQALGASARWKFALYWYLLVGWSSNQMMRLLLEAIKRRAESATARPSILVQERSES
jgi:hypothetical protein